jgi:hypothetical protein
VKVGRPRKDIRRTPGEKPCTRCGVSQDHSDFPPNKSTKDGLASWCHSCHREYGRNYARPKFQPKLDEMMQAIDREPRSDEATARRNRILYEERKNRKQNCAYPGCITKIGYHQDRLCRIHEREMNEEKIARKLAKGLKK